MKLKLFFLIIISIFFISARPARAFEITPIRFLLTADSGTNQTIVLKVKNTETTDMGFSLSVLGMKQDEVGLPVFGREVSPAESWVYPENTPVTIKAGETKSINFIVKVPTQTAPGSYYLGLAAEPVLAGGNAGSVNTRLVSLLTLQVSGLVNESVIIEKWEPLKNKNDDKTWYFDLNFKNNGSVEVLVNGQVHIRNYKGEDIFTQPITAGNKLLVGTKRALAPAVMLQPNLKLPGIYQAQIELKYGKTNQTVSSIAYIVYLPLWSKAFGALLALAFCLFLGRFITKRKTYSKNP